LPYNSNIPQATDQISVSQGQILGNFQAINSLINVNHVGFNVANAGKHNFVELVPQPGTPGSLAGEALIYNANFAQTSTAEIWFLMPQTGFNYPVSNCILSTNGNPGFASNGWQYGSGGTLEKWGTYSAGAAGIINIPIGNSGAGGFGPSFSVIPWNVQLTSLDSSTGNALRFVISAGMSTTNLRVQNGSGGQFMWRVIGA